MPFTATLEPLAVVVAAVLAETPTIYGLDVKPPVTTNLKSWKIASLKLAVNG